MNEILNESQQLSLAQDLLRIGLQNHTFSMGFGSVTMRSFLIASFLRDRQLLTIVSFLSLLPEIIGLVKLVADVREFLMISGMREAPNRLPLQR